MVIWLFINVYFIFSCSLVDRTWYDTRLNLLDTHNKAYATASYLKNNISPMINNLFYYVGLNYIYPAYLSINTFETITSAPSFNENAVVNKILTKHRKGLVQETDEMSNIKSNTHTTNCWKTISYFQAFSYSYHFAILIILLFWIYFYIMYQS